MTRRGHVPRRTCAGCGAKVPQRELLRLVLGPDGAAVPDPDRRAPGRGAYVHDTTECRERALRGGGLSRALRVRVSGVGGGGSPGKVAR